MAGVRGFVTTGEVTLTAASGARVVFMLKARAHQRVLIEELSIMFKGTSPTDTPPKVELVRFSADGTMETLTPVKVNPSDDETLQTSAYKVPAAGYAAPTEDAILRTWPIHPQSGILMLLPYGKEIIVPGGGRIGVRVTPAASQNQTVAIDAVFQE